MPKITRLGGVTDAAELPVHDEEPVAEVEPPAPVDEPVVDDGAQELGQEPAELPARNASKADWVEAAVARGWDRDDAEHLTRDQLIDELTP